VIQAPTFDGTRAVSRTFQLEIDAGIDRLIDVFNVKVHHLDPGNRDGWVDEVMAAASLPVVPPQIDLFSVEA
jgi:hypothetical protein